MSVSTTAAGPSTAPRLGPRTTVAAKLLVALTGLVLVGFVVGHLLGNLQIFLGREVLNDYGEFLHSKPELLWTARIVLLVMIGVHIWLTIVLRRGTFAARPSRYVVERTLETSLPARWMLLSGLLVLAFILYHLAHFTLGWTQQAQLVDPDSGAVQYVNMLELKDPMNTARHDVYGMVVRGFQNPLVVGLYVVAQVLLAMHLYHGVSSMLQTLGLNNGKNKRLLRLIGPVVAVVVMLGYISIPVAVLTGLVGL